MLSSKILIIVLSSISFLIVNTKSNDLKNKGGEIKATDAWELVLSFLDSCVTFGNPADSSAGIFFYSNSEGGAELKVGGEIPDTFIQGAPLKVISHGWNSSHDAFKSFHAKYKRQLPQVNVILVNWKEDAGTINYCHSASQTERVGSNIAKLLQYLIEKNSTHPYVDSDSVHLIGHSLGAHVVGFAGKYFQQLGMGTLNRITGLDPAYPGFRKDEDNRLSKNYARIVDVIHTNGEVEEEFQNANNAFTLGFTEPLGHFDFYPNGGYKQPGCNDGFTLACNHERSTHLYFESIIQEPSKAFKSKKCGTYYAFIGRTLEGCGTEAYNYPGENINPEYFAPEGNYYFCTESSQPFDNGETEGLQCKPTVCDMYRRKGQTGTMSNIEGLHVTLDSFKYSEDVTPNDKEFVGLDEIVNNSPATVTQTVTHSKRTWEKTEMTSSQYWGKINQVCANHAWGGANACHKFTNDCDSTEPLTIRTETESEFSLTREVIVPPFTNIHICSTVSMSKDVEVGFEASARYTGAGLWGEEIARILAVDGISGVIDKTGAEEAVIVQVTGSMKLSLALEPQFVVSDLSEDGSSVCTSIGKIMKKMKNLKASSAFNERSYEGLKIQLEKLITGSHNSTTHNIQL